MREENRIVTQILDGAFKIHSKLGPGLLESAYEHCLLYEIEKMGLRVERQKAIPLVYEDSKMNCGYRADLIVENKVIVEVKAVEILHDIHLAQVLTYLRVADCRLGLLINFNVMKLKDGIRRVANNF